MFKRFPYTDFHELNLDYILDLCNRALGLHLVVSGDKLQLVNQAEEVVSNVTISYATTALQDIKGNDITAYLISAGIEGNRLVFTNGDGDDVLITVPYATKASQDSLGNDLEDYLYRCAIAGDKLRVTHGDGTIEEFTIPFATRAKYDDEDNDLTTYAVSLEVSGDYVVLKDRKGRTLSTVTVPYASTAGDALTAGQADEATHAENADLAIDATNAIETVEIVGDTIKFTTYGGHSTTVTIPYAVKALKDSLGNDIKNTYISNVVNDPVTGKLTFYDATGAIIAELVPTIDSAVHDSLGNTLYDYIKSIVVSQNSDYVTVTHGDGNTDTLTIHYSETAWKDTNGNVIKNFYIGRLATAKLNGITYLVAYNGDTPEAELFRIKLTTVSYDSTNLDLSITFGGN